jgi:FKBP-type peptidyl-prolyl cis-trans isomerase
MRHFSCMVFVTTSVILGACSKGEPEQRATDSTATAPPVATAPATPPPVSPPTAPTPKTTSSVAPKARGAVHKTSKTGTTHEAVKSIEVVKSIGALKYVDVVKGTGEVAQSGMHVMVLYTGRFLNGTVFDSTTDRNEPFDFKLGAGQVIQGWDQGIVGMRDGGKRRLIIPPELGYGQNENGPIPANSTLTFDVELLGFKP